MRTVMVDWLFYLLTAAVLIACLYVTLLTLPGLWLMLVAASLYAWATHFEYVALKTLVAVLILAGLAELIDTIAVPAGAKRAGASRRGLIGAVVGGIAAGLFLSIPLPVIGTLIGICIGTFAGAIVGELWGGTEIPRSLRIGVGAAWGRLLGTLIKLLFGCAIALTVLIAGFPVGHAKSLSIPMIPPPPAHPTVRPLSSPGTHPAPTTSPSPAIFPASGQTLP